MDEIESEQNTNVWIENYITISKIWKDTYIKLYKPWIDSTGNILGKIVDISKETTPQKYKEFVDELTKVYQPSNLLKFDKNTSEKFLISSEESIKLYNSWISELEKNSNMTKEMLQGNPDPATLTKCSERWIGSYEKIFNEMLTFPTRESTKDIFENFIGIPNFYINMVEMSKLWRNTYLKIYGPWIESMKQLSIKIAEIARGDTKPETYRELYSLWMNIYKESYSRYIIQSKPSKEVFESFIQNTNIYLDMYKGWINALEKMIEKAEELSRQTIDNEMYKEFYNLWTKMYGKAFENFFEDMPVMGPMKDLMEPSKNLAKIYADIFLNMSKFWLP